MIRKDKIIVLIYLPWLLSLLFHSDAAISFYIAWIGSFYIFYITIFSSLAPIRKPDNNEGIQVMKPIILIQLIFAGFMCCTSIFYFIDQDNQEIDIISECQRLSLLAHSAMVTGMVLLINPDKKLREPQAAPSLNLVLYICLTSYSIAKCLNYLPPLVQFKYPLQILATTTAAYLLIKGASLRSIAHVISGLCSFSVQFIESTLTGYKEGIIIQILTLAFLSFHYYPKVVLITTLPCLIVALYILPTYTLIMRAESWTNGKSAHIARDQAYQTFFNEGSDQLIIENNWTFLTNRFSEIGMFVKYVKHTPDHQDYIGLEILNNTLITLVPRIFWDEKPVTEKIAMKRVYDAGVAHRASNVSAKTRPVVDGYLIGGGIGIFLLMLCYGIIAQKLCNLSERLFGGYELGCMIMFNSLFQQLWRGNTLEFLLNNIVYGLILMLLIHTVLRVINLIMLKQNNENYTN